MKFSRQDLFKKEKEQRCSIDNPINQSESQVIKKKKNVFTGLQSEKKLF